MEQRSGDEIDLLDASLRTAGGATVSTTLYVVSGIVYAAVTSPAATGTFFFVSITIALVLRPVRGVSQALQKLGSESGESVAAYLGVTLTFAVVYLLTLGVAVTLALDPLTDATVLRRSILLPAAVFALSTTASVIVDSLLAAVGYPSAQTWLNGLQSSLQLVVLLAFAPLIEGVIGLMAVIVATRAVTILPVSVVVGVVPTRPTRRAIERTWEFAKWSVPDQILDRFSYNMPVFVLGVVATPVAVGVYEAADRFADFGATIAWRLSTPLLSKVSGDDSIGETQFAYLDAAVTGGTGVTVVVLGYLLAAHGVVARIAFSETQAVFSTTVIIVGVVNVVRGFWTLASRAIEGVGKPSVSFRTKLFGLTLGVPVTVVLGPTLGAVAGAVGYGVMNLGIFLSVVRSTRSIFGRSLLDTALTAKLGLALVVATPVTAGVVRGAGGVGVPPVVVAVTAAGVCLLVFVGVLAGLSTRTRHAATRAWQLSVGRAM